MRKFGVKLWSVNVLSNYNLVKQISKAVKEGVFDFVELFAFKESFEETHQKIYDEFSKDKVIIHASHNTFGFDTGNVENWVENQKQFNEAQKFADLFSSEIIITHPGAGGEQKHIEETIRQFKMLNDKRLIVENMPSYCSDTFMLEHGATPKEIKQIMDEVNCGFCLDFSHAICAANGLKLDIFKTLDSFLELKPNMYHICDGLMESEEDLHLHIGKGNYPIKTLFEKYTKENSSITMETGGVPIDIAPWEKDIAFLKDMS